MGVLQELSMDDVQDAKRKELERYIRGQLERRKYQIHRYHAELKLNLPKYVKSATMGQIYEAGASVEVTSDGPHLHIPEDTDEFLRKRAALVEKVRDIHREKVQQIKEFYKARRKQLPKDLLKKPLSSCFADEELLFKDFVHK